MNSTTPIYIGIVQQQEFHPRYILQEDGELKEYPKSKKDSFENGESKPDLDPKGQIVKAEKRDTKWTYSSFPECKDHFQYVIIRNDDISTIQEKKKLGPFPKRAFLPLDKGITSYNKEITIYSKSDKTYYGPVTIIEIDNDPNNQSHRFVTIKESDKTGLYKEAKSKLHKNFYKKEYLGIIRKRESPSESPIETEEENKKAIIKKLCEKPKPELCELLFTEAIRILEDDSLVLEEIIKLQHELLRILIKNKSNDKAYTTNLNDNVIPALEGHGHNVRGLLYTAEVLYCDDMSHLYEYYCLTRILEELTNLGFKPDTEKKNERVEYGKNEVRGSKHLANVIHLKRGNNISLTLYREPILHHDKTENGLKLRVRSEENKHPDFVLKLSSNEEKQVDYIILDAKFASAKNIKKNNYLSDILRKYFFEIGTERVHDSIKMVWTMQGGLDEGEPYTGKEEYGDDCYPSFGNCTVNEKDRKGMDHFWEFFKKLLDRHTGDTGTDSPQE